MNAYDANGTQIVCTVTKAEREAQDELPPVHFVQPEQSGWVSE